MAKIGEARIDALRMLEFLRRSALAVTAFLIAAFALLAWDYVVERAEAQVEKNAALTAEYVQRLVQTQDVLLTAANEALVRFVPEGDYDLNAHLFLQRISGRIEGSIGIAFVQSDGRFLITSFQHPAVGQVGAREYLERTPAGGLYIDRIRVKPQDVDALIVARRPDGEAAADGVWVSAVEIPVVRSFLQRITARPGDAASLLREDGVLLMRNYPTEGAVRLSEEQPAVQAMRMGGGIYWAEAISDGRERIYATRKVSGLPLYASFGISIWSLVLDWAIASGVAALLFGTIGMAGYLMARSAARRMRAEAAQAALAFDRRLLEEAEKTASLRETMLRELNHRVKNSLQMIGALIRLQRGRPSGPDLEEITARVQAIAAIHDLLYRSGDEFDVDIAELLRRIATSEAVVPPEGRIDVIVEAEPMQVDVSIATPLALCAVELVTNACKHAYGPEGGRITVSLHKRGAERGLLVVADHGIGLPEGPGRRSGLRVVDELVRQIGGAIRVESGEGARFEIAFPAVRGQDRIVAALAAS